MTLSVTTSNAGGPSAPASTPLRHWADQIWLKCEHEQVSGSFKYRGAYAAVATSPSGHYVTGSSGNHALALAHAVAALRPAARVTCFATSMTPDKSARLGGLGVELRLVPGDNDARDRAAREFAARAGAAFVHSSDDGRMVAGGAALANEILAELPSAARLVAPVGGGGLLAGLLLGARGGDHDVEVVGVEPAGAARMRLSLERAAVTALPTVDTVCDGARAVRPSRLPFEIAVALRPRLRSVPDDRVRATRDELDRRGLWVEYTAALALAATPFDDGRPTVVVLTGGNR
ncbi:pyridoxal-phosphate dependent enzyme [Micromonospora sp. WMMD882]|uniref:pyridoxal-phosphate dependent enzyme n=1 Tax=Micromonospora sp. WMMD882 TaxID=3015151 RepID=UPI00248AC1FE|nr:pyridoxal-phosphate dependent enzyme [Micromonospora sp. WMMD882]WBB78073.1 pyridoxal-phosphate dependent enzyme [Micromonospora sp. WMMD882]